jgi:acetyl esterase/lipase
VEVLHLLGNSQTVASVLGDLVEMSLLNQCYVTTFDYRGVSKSKGKAISINDVFQDCVAQVENLFKNGVKAKNLIISGFSLGGGLATKVVNHYHKIGHKVYLFNDRSFGRLSDVAAAWYGNYLRVVFRKILKFFEWEIEADSLYLQIPAKYKRHINLMGSDDEVVPFYVSLSKRLKDMRQKVSDEFLFYCLDGYKHKGHKAPLKKIINKYGETGEKIFSKFIEDIRNQIIRQ